MSENIILRGTRIVLPEALQQRAIDIAHESHQDLSKIKALLRTKTWFPGTDDLAKRTVDQCIPCEIIQNHYECHPAHGRRSTLTSMALIPLEHVSTVTVDIPNRNRAIDKSSFCNTTFRQDLQCARTSTSSDLQQWALVQQHRILKVYGHIGNTN